MKPNFFIVGAAKAATTSLYHYLCQHPDVFMPNPKEVNYFSKAELEGQQLYYDDYKPSSYEEYKTLFSSAVGKRAIGEASVSYLFYPSVPAKISAVIPDAKIIILIRNPVERSLSHFLMDCRLGLCGCSFDEVLFSREKIENGKLFYQQYVELGLYAEQVDRYLKVFGKKNVLVLLQEDLREKPEVVMQELFAFLALDGGVSVDYKRDHNSFSMPKHALVHRLYRSARVRQVLTRMLPVFLKRWTVELFFETGTKPELSANALAYLQQTYNPDIERLEILIDKDLSEWKS